MVVVADSVMTFYGSTASGAAFTAWTVDAAACETWGCVEGVLNLSVFLAQIVSMVAAGMLINAFGYFTFFYALGGIVFLVGFLGGLFLQEPELSQEAAASRLSF